MHYLVSGLAKSGTTILYSRMERAIRPEPVTFFEPDSGEKLSEALCAGAGQTLSKILIGQILSKDRMVAEFDRHVLIYRDPRDQFISTLLYTFFDFKRSGDRRAYAASVAALEAKLADPMSVSVFELYNLIARLAGRAASGVFARLQEVQRQFIDAFAPFPVRYEDFVVGNIRSLEAYLELSLNNDAEVPERFRRVARSKTCGEWAAWFTAEDLDYANKNWGEHLHRLGYEPVTQCGGAAIAREHSIDYVRQFEP